MTSVYRVHKKKEYSKAGPADLIELRPVPGSHPLYVPKIVIETIVYGIVHYRMIHLSGPTGSAKSSLIEALFLVPENFKYPCTGIGRPVRPLNVYPVEMAPFEAPGELYQRRALKNGTTFDEESKLVTSIKRSADGAGNSYNLIWLREMGRVHSSSVQGGLLDLMTKGDIILPDGNRIPGEKIAWIGDSNYQAEQDSTHTLVTFDDALKRRFSINLTLDYLSAEQEVQVLENIFNRSSKNGKIDSGLIVKVVELGNVIRQLRLEGNLQSVAPPTIYGYLEFLNMSRALPQLNHQQISLATLLGNASIDDRKHVSSVLNDVFGIKSELEEEAVMGGSFF